MKCIGFHSKLGRPRHHSTTDYVVSGVHKGFSGLMNLVANSGEQQSNLLFVNFNQDCTSLAVGSRSGYRLFSLGSVEKLDHVFEIEGEDVCIVERLYSSSLVAIVSLQHPRKLKVCHFKKGTEICNYSYSNSILAVKLNRQRLVVCLEESLYIHNIRDMKILHTIRETPANPNGLCALSVTNESSYLAYPGSNTRGEVQIFDTVNLRAVTMIQAHTGTLAALAFNVQGNKLATASDKGTVIRVFSIPDGHRIFEFRRGMKRCVTIYSLSFSSDGMYLCASSNTETVHVFKLELPKEKPPDESNTWMDMMGNVFKSSASYLPAQVSEMLSQGRSFAIARLPMAGLKNVCAIATIQKLPRLLVASQDGYLYIYNLDPNEGKECGLVKQHRLDGVSSETSAGDQQPHDRPLAHPTSGGAAATGASPPASYAATARRTDLPAVSQPVGTTGKPLASPAAHWTGGESYAQILKRNGGPQELDTVAMLDQLLEEPESQPYQDLEQGHLGGEGGDARDIAALRLNDDNEFPPMSHKND